MEWNFLPVADWMSVCLPGNDPGLVFQPFDVNLNKDEAAMYPSVCKGINNVLEQIGCTEFLASCTGDGSPDTSVSDTLDIKETSFIKVNLSILPKLYVRSRDARQTVVSDPSSQQPSSSHPIPSIVPPSHPISSNATTHLPEDAYMEVDSEDVSPPTTHAAADPNSPPDRCEPLRAERWWPWAEVLVDVKLDPKSFPFNPEHNFLSNGRKYVQSRDHLALCASQLFRVQHRTHVFLISICGRRARLVRFDRSGAIVSGGFDYTTASGVALIGQFLYRLFRPSATPEERGADPTAILASEGEAKFFSSLHLRFPTGSKSRIGKRFEDAADGTWPIYVLNITSPWSQLGDDLNPLPVRKDSPLETHRCLVGKPMYTGELLTVGRGTKCFVGWDLDGSRPVMIKDSWRADLRSILSELDIYMALWEGETSSEDTHIPTPLGGGDVCRADGDGSDARQYQRTLNIAAFPVLPYMPRPERTPRIHTRLVLKEICESLEDFTNGEQMVGVIFGALIAHVFAWERHKILHRDISVDNILIYYSNPNDSECGIIGLLSDWDFARTEHQLSQAPALTWRSETWKYMSALLQFMHGKHYEVSDDLESFMHVLNWCALRYLPNKWSSHPTSLAMRIEALFDRRRVQRVGNGTTISAGVLPKIMAICDGEPFASVTPPDHPFAVLLKDLAVLCQQHYETYDTDQILASSGLQHRDRSAESQPAKPARISAYRAIMASDPNLKRVLDRAAASKVGRGQPTTSTQASSSRPSGLELDCSGTPPQHSNAIVLNRLPAPAASQTRRTVKDRSESPLLDHTRFIQTIWTIFDTEVRWDLLFKQVNTVEYQDMIWDTESSSTESLAPSHQCSTRSASGVAAAPMPARGGGGSGTLLRRVLLKSLVNRPQRPLPTRTNCPRPLLPG